MKNILLFISIVIRLLIIFKVVTLLFSTATGSSDGETIKKLVWWGVFLIFDVWLQQSFPFDKNDKED